MTEPANDLTALCYCDGVWTRIPDPMGARGNAVRLRALLARFPHGDQGVCARRAG
jgi:hypothetical protein